MNCSYTFQSVQGGQLKMTLLICINYELVIQYSK